jgi:N-acetylmuramic acid 6-phosphate etherase
MAVAGSTRMQAVTLDLLVLGTALELALQTFFKQNSIVPTNKSMINKTGDTQIFFKNLLDDIGSTECISTTAQMVKTEERIYSNNGRITYFSEEAGIDLITDTAERCPTFMLPPFRKCDDSVSVPSWAFVKNPLLPTFKAWETLFARPLRCLNWDNSVYEKLGASPKICKNPPKIDQSEILKFQIGNEEDVSRYETKNNLTIGVAAGEDKTDNLPFMYAFKKVNVPFNEKMILQIGINSKNNDSHPSTYTIPCKIHRTFLCLFEHLATKLVFNNISTATMGRMKRLKGNWMVHVATTNKKLIDRGTRLISELCGIGYKDACIALHESMDELTKSTSTEKPSAVAYTIERLRKN